MSESLLARLARNGNKDEAEEALKADLETHQALQEIRGNISYIDNRLLEGNIDAARRAIIQLISNTGKIRRALGHE